jgi:hypothetical protein
MTEMTDDPYPIVGYNDLDDHGRGRLSSIVEYKNPAVVKRYAEDANVSMEMAEKTFNGLKQYLAVCVFTGGKRTPAKLIDECWHTFILHLKDYDEFCQEKMRGMVYHNPAIDNSGMDYYPKTRAGAEALCGELDPEIWPVEHDAYARCISTKDSEAPRFTDCLKVRLYSEAGA